MDAPIVNPTIKPTAQKQAALDAAAAVADRHLVALRAWCYLERGAARPSLEALIALCEQTCAVYEQIFADFERPRTTMPADGVDSYAALQILHCEHYRYRHLLAGARRLLDTLPVAGSLE
jgi:hypothetical protein